MASRDPHLAALERHLHRTGHLMVSQSSDAQLYPWASRQRLLWRDGQLDRTIERKLRKIGFPFEVEDCEWEHAFSQVAHYRRQLGRLPPPSTPAGRWLQRQRELSETGTLPRSREDRLRAEGAFDPSDHPR